jgi:glycine cleavage system aminomethyltransferase T
MPAVEQMISEPEPVPKDKICSQPISEPALKGGIPSCLFSTNFCPPRFRKSCYYDATVRWGVKSFATYNHMLLPTCFSSPEEEYQNLKANVCIWDVAAERQVEIAGPDAVQLAEMLTPRAMGGMKIGECRYAICTDENGMVINDPLALRIADDKFWFSIADSDLLFWAKALALGKGLDVRVTEPDVSPLALQGPKSLALMMDVFGEWVGELKFFGFQQTHLDGVPMIVARSGWSPERGYEIYLQDGTYGDKLWERMMEAGRKYSITPGVPNHIRRIEGGMFSYGTDCSSTHNVMELGLPLAWTGPSKKADFISKKALERLVAEGGPTRQIVGVEFLDCPNSTLPPLMEAWKVFDESGAEGCGEITSVCFSPTIGSHIAIGTLEGEARAPDTAVLVEIQDGRKCRAVVRKLPFMPRAD